MGRIEQAFAAARQRGTAALVPFLTAGDPDLAATGELVAALEAGGADLIELGFPFSDPMADGPVIQAASERALAAGTTLVGVLEAVRAIRTRSQIPLVLMGYYNPVFRYGVEDFVRDAAAAGVDGVLLVDLPPEEAGEMVAACRRHEVRFITLIAPTTPPERRRQLAAAAEGYLYYVSMTGVTGVQSVDAGAIAETVRVLRAESAVPVAVGFGITTPGEAARVAGFADAVVVGSALVKVVATHGRSAELLPAVQSFVAALKRGISEER